MLEFIYVHGNVCGGGKDIVVLVGEVVKRDSCGEGENFLMYVLRYGECSGVC